MGGGFPRANGERSIRPVPEGKRQQERPGPEGRRKVETLRSEAPSGLCWRAGAQGLDAGPPPRKVTVLSLGQSYRAGRGETCPGCHRSKSLGVLWAQTSLLRKENQPRRLITKDTTRQPPRGLSWGWGWRFSLRVCAAEPSWSLFWGGQVGRR